MSSSTKMVREEHRADIAADNRRSRIPTRTIGTFGVIAIAILLLGWGISATQWTVLTNNNNLQSAIANGEIGTRNEIHTYTYSIPQGTERDIYVGLYFEPRFFSSWGPDGSLYYGRARPVSNSTTTSEYYVSFSMTGPNGSAVDVWFTSPQGNLTQDCNGGGGTTFCHFSPSTAIVVYSRFFLAPTEGNYTIHLLSTQCTALDNPCTSTNATVSVTRALSSVIYNRPYYNAGLATVIVASISLATAVMLTIITSYRTMKKREREHRQESAVPPFPMTD